MRTNEERLGTSGSRPTASTPPPPPRPARRRPTVENRYPSRPAQSPSDEYEDQYDDPQSDDQSDNRSDNRSDDRSINRDRGQYSGEGRGRQPSRRDNIRNSQYNRPPRQPNRQYEQYYDQAEDDAGDYYEEGETDEQGPEVNAQGERVIFRINQAFYPAAVAYAGSIACSSAVAAAVAWLKGPFWLVLIFAIVFFIPAIVRHIQLLRTVYILTDTKIEIVTGLLSKTSRNIPLRHLQDVSVSETWKERLIGIGDIIIDTAASESKMSIDNINEPRKYADLILDQLHRYE